MSNRTISRKQAEELDKLLNGPTDTMKSCIAVRDLMGRMEAVVFTVIEYHMLSASHFFVKLVNEEISDEERESRIEDFIKDMSEYFEADFSKYEIPEILLKKIVEQCENAIRISGRRLKESKAIDKMIGNLFGGALRDVLKDFKLE